MNNQVFNIRKLFNDAFNVDVANAPTEFKIPQAAATPFTGIRGQQFFESDANGVVHYMPVTIDGVVLPFALIDITEKKTIVRTPMVEHKGSVKELISLEDAIIIVKALLINTNQVYPEKQVMEWRNIYKKNTVVDIQSIKTDLFLEAEDKVVITDAKWPSLAGVQNIQPLELTLETDSVYDLIIK